jgi:hypothetical protein
MEEPTIRSLNGDLDGRELTVLGIAFNAAAAWARSSERLLRSSASSVAAVSAHAPR